MSAHADSGSPIVRVRATHLIRGAGPDQPGDALAVLEEPGTDAEGTRTVFVPARLPCGECAICRRGLGSVCPAAREGLSQARPIADLPERYLTPITDPQVTALDPAILVSAGLVAEALDATARSGLGPGETAVWLGGQPWSAVGAAFTARRGCRAFLLQAAAPSTPVEGVTWLRTGDGPQRWRETVEAAEAAASAGPRSARPERRLYVYGRSDDLATDALTLAGPGATISFRQGAPAVLEGLDAHPALRLLVGGGYHPDLIPEALAALARGQVDLSGVLDVVRLTP